MKTLHISLGHNASAVLARGGIVERGYEQERLDKIKSSSAYPREAIAACLEGDDERVDETYVSHWFDAPPMESNKYVNLSHLHDASKLIYFVDGHFTHHDAHASSAVGFYRSNGGEFNEAYVVVLDGFGTMQECFSVYETRNNGQHPKLAHRTYGYSLSLGLMYQYTTEYLGMKPNQDEYKLLGYESQIMQYAGYDEIKRAIEVVARQAHGHAKRMLDATSVPQINLNGQLIDMNALRTAKAVWWENADQWKQLFAPLSEHGTRAVVAFCAQLFIEVCVQELLCETIGSWDSTSFGPAPMIMFSGGCFYNVKLNRRIQRALRRRCFFHPLAGDQGAAIGMSHSMIAAPGLCWGKRDLFVPLDYTGTVKKVAEDEWVEAAASALTSNQIVNVVRGWMEFGPRALCNTTTFALPYKKNVSRINFLNQRDEAMPMAPVVGRREAMRLFNHDELLEIPVSDRFMITTVGFQDNAAAASSSLNGVSHRDPLHRTYTARPQVVDDDDPVAKMLLILGEDCLINTSFNYHGKPIVFSVQDAVDTHRLQVARKGDMPITLIVVPS